MRISSIHLFLGGSHNNQFTITFPVGIISQNSFYLVAGKSAYCPDIVSNLSQTSDKRMKISTLLAGNCFQLTLSSLYKSITMFLVTLESVSDHCQCSIKSNLAYPWNSQISYSIPDDWPFSVWYKCVGECVHCTTFCLIRSKGRLMRAQNLTHLLDR